MYLIDVEIKPSEIHGRGVFAAQRIKQGDIVWKFNAGHDKVLSNQEFNALNREEKELLQRIAYLSPTTKRYVYPPENDPARYTNHSEKNNLSVCISIEVSEEPYFIANRNIDIGEELTNSYKEFDESIKKYKPKWL